MKLTYITLHYLHYTNLLTFFFTFLATGLQGLHAGDAHLRFRTENVALAALGVLQRSGVLQLSINSRSSVGLWLIAWECSIRSIIINSVMGR